MFMESFVYVIASDPQGPVKIGYSADPQKRLAQLQTGHADRLHLYHAEPFTPDRAPLFEKIIHKTVNHHRRTGEWFGLSVKSAIGEITHAVIRYGDMPVRDLKEHR